MTRVSFGIVAASALALGTALTAVGMSGSQDASVLKQADAPQGAVWVDSLDFNQVAATTLRRPTGRGGRGGAPATPPPPPTYALGGVTYPHAVPMLSDRDVTINLKGQATKFASMVGID